MTGASMTGASMTGASANVCWLAGEVFASPGVLTTRGVASSSALPKKTAASATTTAAANAPPARRCCCGLRPRTTPGAGANLVLTATLTGRADPCEFSDEGNTKGWGIGSGSEDSTISSVSPCKAASSKMPDNSGSGASAASSSSGKSTSRLAGKSRSSTAASDAGSRAGMRAVSSATVGDIASATTSRTWLRLPNSSANSFTPA